MQDFMASRKQRRTPLTRSIILCVLIFGILTIIPDLRREFYQHLAHQSLQHIPLPPGVWMLPEGGEILHSYGCGPEYIVTETSVYSSKLSVDQIMSFYDQHLNDFSSWNVTSRGGNGLSAQMESNSRVTVSIFIPDWVLTSDVLNDNTKRQPNELALIQALSRGEEPFSITLYQSYAPLLFIACPEDHD